MNALPSHYYSVQNNGACVARCFHQLLERDKAVADKVCHLLEAANIACWIALRNQRAGERSGPMIVRGMNESKVVVFILSTHFYNSAACKKELSLAYQKGKVTIPVRAEDVAVSEEFEWYLTGLHRVEALTPLVDQHFDELVEAVRSKIESPRHEAPAGQNTEDTEATIASFDKAPGIDPRNALAWNRMGFSLNYLGQYDEAIASFDKALAIDLRNHAALNRKQEAFNALAKKR